VACKWSEFQEHYISGKRTQKNKSKINEACINSRNFLIFQTHIFDPMLLFLLGEREIARGLIAATS